MIVHRVFDEVLRTWSNVAVLRALLDTATGYTGNEVARVAGMDPRAALKALTRLEQLGLVRRQRGGRDHLFTLNREHYLVRRGILPLFAVERGFLDEIASAVRASINGHALSVVLFGSTARGEEQPESDFDVCCIVKDHAQRERAQSHLERSSQRLYNRYGIKLGPIFFTLDEFRHKRARRNALVNQILDHGKLIAGKNPKVLIHD